MNRGPRLIAAAALTVYGVVSAGPACVAEPGEAAARITLKDVISQVIAENPDIESARIQWEISRHTLHAAYGAFEPALVGNWSRGASMREKNAVERVSQGSSDFNEESLEFGAGLEGRILGSAYRVGYSMRNTANNLVGTYLREGDIIEGLNRADGDEDSQEPSLRFRSLDDLVPEYESFAGISVTVPLLRNGGINAPMAEVRAARHDALASFQNYRKQLMMIISRAESSYWNLVLAKEQDRMAQESVDIAVRLVEDSKERLATGKMSELDSIEAEAGLAIREAEKADMYQKMLNAMVQLKLLLSDSRLPATSRLEAEDPLDASMSAVRDHDELRRESYRSARDWQPDYLIKCSEWNREQLRWEYAKNQCWPQLDVVSSYGLTGLGETGSESEDHLNSGDYTAWSVGFQLRFPFGLGIRERNEAVVARLRTDLAFQQLRAIEYEIASSIDVLVQRLTSFREQVGNAGRVIEARKQLLDVEFLKMAEGKSTSRRIFEVEEELSKAKRRQLESLVRYRETLMQLNYIRGSILRAWNLESSEKGRIILVKALDPEEWSGATPPVEKAAAMFLDRVGDSEEGREAAD